MDAQLMKLDASDVSARITRIHTSAVKAAQLFDASNNIHMRAVATDLVLSIEGFMEHVPVILALRHAGMRDRHWMELNSRASSVVLAASPVKGTVAATALPFFAKDSSITLREALRQGLVVHEAIVLEVCELAQKEHEVEQQLDSMVKLWTNTPFDLVPHPPSGSYFVRGIPELLSTIDEHGVVTQMLMVSPYHGPHEPALKKWMKSLNAASDVLDAWLTVQRIWLQLWPLFQSADLPSSLPNEAKLFTSVHRFWTRTITAIRRGKRLFGVNCELGAAKSFRCIVFCDCTGDGSILDQGFRSTGTQGASSNAGESEGIQGLSVMAFCTTPMAVDRLREASRNLDTILKGLHKFLQSKRQVFPRFYFLSDDEMLQVCTRVCVCSNRIEQSM
jgi:dynein heavy chain, axonemal